jgi:hypothetical protein
LRAVGVRKPGRRSDAEGGAPFALVRESQGRHGAVCCYTAVVPRLGSTLQVLRWAALAGLGLACGDDSTPGTTTFSATTGSPPGTTATPTTETTGSGDTGTSEESSSDDAAVPQCPGTHQCVPVPPDGWEGPVVLLESAVDEDEPECEGSYAEPATVGYHGLVAPPAECSCACGGAADVSCPLTLIARFWGTDATCSQNVPAQYQLSTASCNNLPAPLEGNTYWTVPPVQSMGGSCEPSAHVEIEPARFEQRTTACGGAVAMEGCAEDQVCTPRPDDAHQDGICVWAQGDQACPPEYPEARTLHTDVVDERGCEACTCDDPVGLCDAAVLTLLSQPCAAPTSGIVLADGHCYGTNSNQTRSVAVNPGQPAAFCLPSEAIATGAASPDGSITVCCR